MCLLLFVLLLLVEKNEQRNGEILVDLCWSSLPTPKEDALVGLGQSCSNSEANRGLGAYISTYSSRTTEP